MYLLELHMTNCYMHLVAMGSVMGLIRVTQA